MVEKSFLEVDADAGLLDPDEIPIRDRKLVTQPQDMTIDSLYGQIQDNTIHVRPLSDKPRFQRKYVWSDKFASQLIESLILNVPIPPIYMAEDDSFEYDVIDGQQRVFSIYRFLDNRYKLIGLEVLNELNGKKFFELEKKLQLKIKHKSLRCVVITADSHPEIKFEVFERLNTNTAPLNAQELRNCTSRGAFNELLGDLSEYEPWLNILGRKTPDKRLRDEELILRYFAFHHLGLGTYRTPQKHWLNEMAKIGSKLDANAVEQLSNVWKGAVDRCLMVFEPNTCFRRSSVEPGGKKKAANKALMDIILYSFTRRTDAEVKDKKVQIRRMLKTILKSDDQVHFEESFNELISRAVDHTSRVKKRFKLWNEAFVKIFE